MQMHAQSSIHEIIESSTYPTPAKVWPSPPPLALRSGAVHRLHGVGHTNNDQQSAETEVGAAEELTSALRETTSVVHSVAEVRFSSVQGIFS